MTLHAAKGLEFPLVIIAGCEDGLIPLGFSFDPQDIEEERRLFYVGMTRAQSKLILLSAASRFSNGERIERRESRFLENLDAGDAMETLEPSVYGPIRARAHETCPVIFCDAATAMPAAKERSSETFQPGTAIFHETFGPGRIIQLSGKTGDMHAIVDFRSVGRKHLMLKFANLRKL